MSSTKEPGLGINSWLEEELYQQYLHDRQAVDPSWKQMFEANGKRLDNGGAPAAEPVRRAPAAPVVEPGPGEELVAMRGIAGKIAENMEASLSLPLATSQRTIPVKVIDENRRIVNLRRTTTGKSKVSYTHIIGWAIVRALRAFPQLNHAYSERGGQPFRIVRPQVNLGIAVDVETREGARNLVVPNIKNAGSLDFEAYMARFDDLVARARRNKLALDDFQATTISLTNPGTVGTMGSIPRLMPGQGAIVAVGTIDYPPQYLGVAPDVRAALGISKVMTVTCTYDHRIIQGAESGMFLGKIQALLDGEEEFYDEIFASLKMPHRPVQWSPDLHSSLPGVASRQAEIAKEAAVIQLINAYRVRGHIIADLDPLGSEPQYHPELDPATYGLTIWDLDREFPTGTLGGGGEVGPKAVSTLREILETLRQTYCAKIGPLFMNIQSPDEKRWLQRRMEPEANNWPLGRETRLEILNELIRAEEFEHFLHTRFVGQKRFALEGAESAIAILDHAIDRAADNGVQEIVIGMAHRGRLNVLANVVGKPLTQVFAEFEGHIDPTSTQGSGDVKYHLGATGIRQSPAGKDITVSVAPNPSHLEAVDPVVQGIVRPKQDRLGDKAREKVIPILVHGDAAFAGQGVVQETLQMSQLPGYRTGGTIHLVINNQIGFTTLPDAARSAYYSTDVARMVQAPIFHVNGDDPEACIRAVQVAFDFRQAFKKDVVIDMVCYRRHGHNEGDDPSFTQPIMYRKIRQHPSAAVQYAERLVREKVLTLEEVAAMRKSVAQRLNEAFDQAQRTAERYELQELSTVPAGDIGGFCPRTSIDRDLLERVVEGITRFPETFHIHPKLRTFVEKRREVLRSNGVVDWAYAEALAFGSLVLEGTPVRLSGQDSGRGTFSQRHLIFYDSETAERYIPMCHLSPDQAHFQVYDSSLSEYAVLGFEFGFSVADPLTLVMWEAQFGDFVNGAQIMIDQFISSSEQKWGQPNGVVMLLPHGFEGQGPEHSSARIERFLTACAQENFQVCNCTTAAQYFHLLRRQMFGGSDRRGMRKPLVLFTPKSLLRHPGVASPLEAFTGGGFQTVIDDPVQPNPATVGRVAFCSGKVYLDLHAQREAAAGDVALVRVEQLYPFPEDEVREILEKYGPDADVVWVQEEPRNMGPWRFIQENLQPLLDESGRTLRYIGRAESASPATGSYKRHLVEQAEIVDQTLRVDAAGAGKVHLVATRKKRP
ncbi:MAG: multifunctional oxoglutarate decarboxylase/oxoglutarate dehydrogenase thiamine pyrophosphate-binding subunit/dihydrolipoyllysine-residue succinyltransferase subunit [Bryobacterales bacterium]|nr:multifunctional oxoglutarate decarboxylase/oxoglutarate dehydrogenase thiamine pyrophosphate-binding subunit/dihydrolipoyllysine-residue succinyltransferase subunit [Bryobacterales bacterium]